MSALSIEDVGYRAGMNPDFVRRARENEAKRKRERRLASLRPVEEERRELAEERRQLALERLDIEGQRKTLEETREIVEQTAATARSDLALLENARLVFSPYDRIEKRFCQLFGISKAELLSASRAKRLVFCRQAICYWAFRRTGQSLIWIGRRLKRDHASVIHSRDTYPVKRAKMGRKLRTVCAAQRGE